MKYAVIDMGSNSIRLMIATVEDGKLKCATKHLAMTRLGAGVDATKTLSEASMEATMLAVADFKKLAETEGATLIGAFATSAVRDAVNGEAFAKRTLEKTGVVVTILSGSEEAELGYKGVLTGVSDSLKSQKFLIIDIGGGSTELIVGTTEGILYRHSFNVGTVRMTGKHIVSDPISEKEDDTLKTDVSNILSEGIAAVKALSPTVAIGIGGTATTFGAMDIQMTTYERERVHNLKVTRGHLKDIVLALKEATVSQKKTMAGLMPKRADVIYAGGVILEHLLEQIDLDAFYVSDYDNLEGILVEKNLI